MYFQTVNLNESSCSFIDIIEKFVFDKKHCNLDEMSKKIDEEYEKHKTDKSWIDSKLQILETKYKYLILEAHKEKDIDANKARILKNSALEILKFINFLHNDSSNLINKEVDK